MIKIFCDKCKEEIPDGDGKASTFQHLKLVTSLETELPQYTSVTEQLCNTCTNKIHELFKTN